MTQLQLPPVVRRWRFLAAVMGVGALAGGGVLLAASSNPSTALSLHTTAATRVLDTRPASQVGPRSTPLGAAETVDFVIAGLPDDATAVSVNVTVTDGTHASFLAMYPTGDVRPGTSTVNWASTAAVANSATVNIHSDHSLRIYNDQGSVNVIVDLMGFYAPSPASGTPGPKGDTGAPGADGDDGIDGAPGPLSPSVYAFATNASVETVFNGEAVTFDTAGAVAGIDFVAGGSDFTVPTTGVYKVTFGVVSDTANQFDIRVDGLEPAIPLVFGAFEGEANEGTAVVSANAGEVITLVNLTSGSGTDDVILSPPRGGTDPAELNAWMMVEQMNG